MHNSYEWRQELAEKTKSLTWEKFEKSPFAKFVEPLRKLGFTPTRVVFYRCMYKSDFPSRKWVLHRKTKSGYDTAVFCECIHNFEMKLKVAGDLFKSGPIGSSTYYMEQMFCDFLLEKEKCRSVLGSTAVFRHYQNKPKIIYNPWQTKNPNLLAKEFLPSHKKKLKLTMLSLLAFVNKKKPKHTTTK